MIETKDKVGSQGIEGAATLIAPPAGDVCVKPDATSVTDGAPMLPGMEDAALSILSLPIDPADEESMRFVDFVRTHAHELYRLPLEELYVTWQGFNEQFFEERLKLPHLTIASGPPRALGFFKTLTDYGGRTQITIDARIVAARRKFVNEPWPAEGTRLFVHDILLHETVHQYLAEVEHHDDQENAKHGEAFTDVCNRIGKTMGLPRVYTRRRGPQDAGKPAANSWPINVRPAGYYLGHVNPPREGRIERGPDLRGLAGAVNLFRYLLDAGQIDKLAGIVHREAERTHEHTCKAKPAAEKGAISRLDPAWLAWNNGCIKQLLHAIGKRKMTDLMPLLGDALESAGCRDELLLTHCHLPVRHTRDCWVAKCLLEAEKGAPTAT
jgi:hypothetical protein